MPPLISKNKTKYTREIIQYDLNGNIVNRFDSTAQAKIAIGKPNDSHIASVLNGKRKTAYNYIWRYADEVEDNG